MPFQARCWRRAQTSTGASQRRVPNFSTMVDGAIHISIRERGEYRSNFFYDQQPRDVLKQDIEEGDRTRHRGYRQEAGRLPDAAFRHVSSVRTSFCSCMGFCATFRYSYSTSTTPLAGLRYGPAFQSIWTDGVSCLRSRQQSPEHSR